MDPVIKVEGLSKEFKIWQERPTRLKELLIGMLKGERAGGKVENFWALKDINFEVYPGEFVGIMGRNGAGKSTLFKIMADIYSPTEGRVQVNGQLLPIIELGAGFQPEMTGYENIFLNAAIMGVGRKAVMKALPQILAFSELGDMIYRPLKNYSSGMVVRLGFSVAAHIAGDVLLVDEVLAVGDLKFQKRCLARIKELHESGRAIILVTHSPETMLHHCTRCLIIEDHKLYYDGNVEDANWKYHQLLLED